MKQIAQDIFNQTTNPESVEKAKDIAIQGATEIYNKLDQAITSGG